MKELRCGRVTKFARYVDNCVFAHQLGIMGLGINRICVQIPGMSYLRKEATSTRMPSQDANSKRHATILRLYPSAISKSPLSSEIRQYEIVSPVLAGVRLPSHGVGPTKFFDARGQTELKIHIFIV